MHWSIFKHFGSCRKTQWQPALPQGKRNYVIVDRDGDVHRTYCGTQDEAISKAEHLARTTGAFAPFVVHELHKVARVGISTEKHIYS